MAGFTLLEMLVVVLVLGLVAATALPAMGTMWDSVQLAMQRETFERELEGLSYKAHALGTDIILDQDGGAAAAAAETPVFRVAEAQGDAYVRAVDPLLPQGWRVLTSEPIRFRASGFCTGGTVTLERGRAQVEYQLVPPYCQIGERD